MAKKIKSCKFLKFFSGRCMQPAEVHGKLGIEGYRLCIQMGGKSCPVGGPVTELKSPPDYFKTCRGGDGCYYCPYYGICNSPNRIDTGY